jgi:hypothetical protein
MGQNVKWDKLSNRNNIEYDKMSNAKMSNGTKRRMSNGTKCRRIVENVKHRLGVIVSMFVTVVCCCC